MPPCLAILTLLALFTPLPLTLAQTECFSDADCSPTAYCIPSVNECWAKEVNGKSCKRHNACISGFCDLGATKTCADKGSNVVCTPFSKEPTTCAAGQYCNRDTRICKDTLADGATCTAHESCVSKNCDVRKNVCAPWGDSLIACSIPSDCYAGEYCREPVWAREPDDDEEEEGMDIGKQGRCYEKGFGDEECAIGEGCHSGSCVDLKCTYETCVITEQCPRGGYCEDVAGKGSVCVRDTE